MAGHANLDLVMRAFGRLLFFLLLVLSSAAPAQQIGSLFGSVTDENGAALPAASVTLTGAAGATAQATNGNGQFRFQGLAPGDYRLKVHVEGFTDDTLAIPIRPEQNAITIRMKALRE